MFFACRASSRMVEGLCMATHSLSLRPPLVKYSDTLSAALLATHIGIGSNCPSTVKHTIGVSTAIRRSRSATSSLGMSHGRINQRDANPLRSAAAMPTSGPWPCHGDGSAKCAMPGKAFGGPQARTSVHTACARSTIRSPIERAPPQAIPCLACPIRRDWPPTKMAAASGTSVVEFVGVTHASLTN